MNRITRRVTKIMSHCKDAYQALEERMESLFFAIVIKGDRCLRDKRGQGTTEYAILVGVLVVIAIIAVAAFRGKLQELWSSISEGINGL